MDNIEKKKAKVTPGTGTMFAGFVMVGLFFISGGFYSGSGAEVVGYNGFNIFLLLGGIALAIWGFIIFRKNK